MSENTKEAIIQANSEAMGIPGEIYATIVTSSFEESDPDIVELEGAIEKTDMESIQIIAHRLKGVFGNLKLDDVFAAAQNIDGLAKEASEIDKIKEHFVELKEAYESIKTTFTS